MGRQEFSEATLREKNQLTLPSAVVSKIGAHIGQRFIVESRGNTVLLHLVPDSFAGTMEGVYGSSEDANAYVEGERAAWE
jgi:hypothetical protein